jgi:methylphosphotriester-DNA--protein-cysteine methyltransferase
MKDKKEIIKFAIRTDGIYCSLKCPYLGEWEGNHPFSRMCKFFNERTRTPENLEDFRGYIRVQKCIDATKEIK